MSHQGTRQSGRDRSRSVRRSSAPRCLRSCTPRLGWLEDRTLLTGLAAGPTTLDLAAEAVPLALDSLLTGTIAPLGATYYQVSSEQGGDLSVTLEALGFPARLSLVDAMGNLLVQSDGSATSTGDGLINVNFPAGVDFLEVQSLGGGGTYKITDDLIPTDPALEPLPIQSGSYAPIAVGDLSDNGAQDLVTPDGIHLGVGDGTFENKVVAGPLADSGWTVTAIAVGNFSQNALPDIAFTEISPDRSTANLCVLENQGDGQFHASIRLGRRSCPPPFRRSTWERGSSTSAVSDYSTGHVAIFTGDGNGDFTPGPVLYGGSYPVAMVSGSFDDGHSDLVVADQGNPITGAGEGLTMFQYDGAGQFEPSAMIPLAAAPSALAAGDFGNGNLDLAIANYANGDVSVLLGNGEGTFSSTPPDLRRGQRSRGPCGVLASRQRRPRPGDRQRELRRRFGTPGHRRWYLPVPAPLPGRLATQRARGGRVQQR